MAFAIRNLSVLTYANGFTLWHYKSGSDDQKTVHGRGYFNDAGDVLSFGDMIFASASDAASILSVSSAENGVRVVLMGAPPTQRSITPALTPEGAE